MNINKVHATEILRKALEIANTSAPNFELIEEIKHFVALCEQANTKTHIAFYATSLLAKTADESVNLFEIKPTHSDNPKSYSARSLCHSVIVPFSVENHISIGVTGREPLNNQPYFRMRFFGDGTPFSSNNIEKYLNDFLNKLSSGTSADAFNYLVAFFQVMKQNAVSYTDISCRNRTSIIEFIDIVSRFVGEDSEGGKKAQAVVAGLLDTYYGTHNVDSGRINDPSRHYPGDVFVNSPNPQLFSQSFEVRDKPVTQTDVQIFVNKCVQYGKTIPNLVMVSPRQQVLDLTSLTTWALTSYNLYVKFYLGWSGFIYGKMSEFCCVPDEYISQSVNNIRERLIQVEISVGGMNSFKKLLS